ncbi:MAG: hypothetical protein HN742_28820 [Lentisphaerae bacterium]|nr:hypothetical protein [Lentisphaerota bacterium]MBT4817371.1 hypothetical protein [Lentisphaerota bacterium]MBT5611880.1 hypothetical protein [Lentisphaerota bacterium]MBT7054955.1 hypothetical protein [Lentisphaerota bacterium]MBT7845911.1 hypothetical protein [Lentisphaerota bacterium]
MMQTPKRRASQLIVCGWDEVSIWDDIGPGDDIYVRALWSWRARDCSGLPEEFRGLFNTTDECKPFGRTNRLLITSSGGAVALVDRDLDTVLFYGRAGNAHSADLLPNNRLAVAASHVPDGTGDRLIVFDVSQPERELYSTDLCWGHGVVWDDDRQQLWALATGEIHVYVLEQWESPTPELRQVDTIPLPETGGHDLSTVPGGPFLSVTTRHHCWVVHRDTGAITPHPQLGDAAYVKSVSHHPDTQRVVYIQATKDCWWSECVRFCNPSGVAQIPGEHFYKARWNV